MKIEDQHIEVSISINGNTNVSFNTIYGWCSETSIVIDAIHLKQAVEMALKFLDVDIVPHENMVDNEVYLGESDVSMDNIRSKIKSIVYMKDDEIVFEVKSTVNIKVKFLKSYTRTTRYKS